MNKVGIKTSQIMPNMALQACGYHKLPCRLWDVYNKVAGKRHKEKLDSDWLRRSIRLFGLSFDERPQYICVILSRWWELLANRFWANGNARIYYMIFGDVLPFDTIYRTNKYNKPLLILVGVNYYFDSYIFEFTILLDETIDTFF